MIPIATREAVEEAKWLAADLSRRLKRGEVIGSTPYALECSSKLETLLTALQAREEENARLSSECGKLASRCLHEAQGKQALQSALAEALGAMERIMSVETYPAAFLIAREARERLTNGEGGGA